MGTNSTFGDFCREFNHTPAALAVSPTMCGAPVMICRPRLLLSPRAVRPVEICHPAVSHPRALCDLPARTSDRLAEKGERRRKRAICRMEAGAGKARGTKEPAPGHSKYAAADASWKRERRAARSGLSPRGTAGAVRVGARPKHATG